MTQEEAYLFFSINDLDDLEDAYEEKLFEHKQFFLSKAVIPSVFLKRLEKVEILENAYASLNEETKQVQHFSVDPFEAHPNIETHVQRYQVGRNQLKLFLTQAQNGQEIIQLVTEMIRLEAKFIAAWDWDETSPVLLGKEPDPMDVWREIKVFGGTFEELKQNQNDAPIILVNEMKRLSLLFKKFPWATY